MRDSWRVDYNYPDGSHYAFVVCRACVDALRPVRLTLDLVALRDYRGEQDLSAVVSLVESIVSQRGHPPVDVLSLRWADVHLLAETYDDTAEQFAALLRRADVLARADEQDTD